MPVEISSDTPIDIDKSFKIKAGPGTGKTYWIVEHIKNVSKNSTRLFSTKKILCITYTNIAAETIMTRLGSSTTQVEVLTIHSFLYKHIIKPYMVFISEEYNFDISNLDGHDDKIVSDYSFLQEWKARTGQQRIQDDHLITYAFSKIRWKLQDDELIPRTEFPIKYKSYPIKNDSYQVYKEMAWSRGVLHHDDVLYFSFQILKKFPFVIKVLNQKFPYIFVDEFQDSNPIQVDIIKRLSGGSTIGVIGDIAQSIYLFQGASPQLFEDFTLPEMGEYYLTFNRRSSNEIIDFLNEIRSDLTQNYYRNVSVSKPTLFVGDMVEALKRAKSECSDQYVYTLSRNNITSNAMKSEINGTGMDDKLLKKIIEIDSNPKRANLLTACISAVALAKQSKFKDAIKTLENHINNRRDRLSGRKKALNYLTTLMQKYEDYRHLTMLEFSEFVRSDINENMPKATKGKGKVFYESHSFHDVSLCVNISEDISYHRTIHKSKGDEFENVLLILTEQADLKFIYEPDLYNYKTEEHRIYYVGASRARNNLFLTVPELDAETEAIISSTVNIHHL
ncbi:UvrD-helicase domain-containing protein [Chryseobacterium aureum]|uniref:UvrD-helicase domain-containing protein n=1 Tax=Chryseobacterium aureum TaxID=2497456 RepID=UPI000F88BFAB|nr:ATP-dependent helicase [Chryseobacterium aureum]